MSSRPVVVLFGFALFGIAPWFAPSTVWAQRDLKDIPPPDPELERATFQVADGFEVNLYAADPKLAKPIQMNFDPAGRLWVASSETYPQILPGQASNDKILVLEDRDGDGQAETTTVFADGLLIPTGVEPGDGGAYVGASTELLHLRDTDGDGRADTRRIVLSGFGTEDTHHIIHTLRWGLDGALYFNQSVYIHSHLETPYGPRRLNGGGIWQLRPDTLRLEVFARGWWNSWGHHFNRWGQSFVTDGAGGKGINHAFPGSVFEASPSSVRILSGLNPGSPKFCGLEVVSGRHLPDDWQGSLLTHDFRGHRVCRFTVVEDGSGFRAREQPELIRSNHAAFRPIDVKMGPDGAIYIADWYNPIIQHGEVDFRDPRRDHTHGRIWRVTVRGRALAPRPRLAGASNSELLDALRAAEGYTRQQARRVLQERGASVTADLAAWTAALSNDMRSDPARLEALWTYQALDVIEPGLLKRLLAADDYHVRAAAVRVLRAWQTAVPESDQLLARACDDEHPLVRLEAVVALTATGTAEAAVAALRVLEQPVDTNLDFALWNAARETAARWLPHVADGSLSFATAGQLLFALRAVDDPRVVPPALTALATKISPDETEVALELVARHGAPEQLRLVLDRATTDDSLGAEQRVALLNGLAAAGRQRRVLPSGDLSTLRGLFSNADPRVVAAAAQAAEVWRVGGLRSDLTRLATSVDGTAEVRAAAIAALGALGSPARETLVQLTQPAHTSAVRRSAVVALVGLDLSAAAAAARVLLADDLNSDEVQSVVDAFINQKQGAARLATALADAQLPVDAAKRAIRAVRLSGKSDDALIAAVRQAAGLSATPREPTAAEIEALAARVVAEGDPARGERIYRRSELACQKCHALGGAGGAVGPDMLSLGATAQLDYLVESVLAPSRKIKENYHSLVVQTDDGRVLTGVKVRESDQELVLRNADDAEVRIPRSTIEQQANGPSLMPAGLADELTRGELLDLVRFLSELGKSDAYSVGRARVARSWQALQMNNEPYVRLGRTGLGTIATDDRNLVWQAAYSTVAGDLPLDSFATLRSAQAGKPRPNTPPVGFIRTKLVVAAEGPVRVRFNSIDGLQAWVGMTTLPLEPETTLELRRGEHWLTLAVNTSERSQPIRVELVDAPNLAGRADWRRGK